MSMNVGQLACYDQAKEFVAEHVTKVRNTKSSNRFGLTGIGINQRCYKDSIG
jgi:hypothetical protein